MTRAGYVDVRGTGRKVGCSKGVGKGERKVMRTED